jgi:hypothetical protein
MNNDVICDADRSSENRVVISAKNKQGYCSNTVVLTYSLELHFECYLTWNRVQKFYFCFVDGRLSMPRAVTFLMGVKASI